MSRPVQDTFTASNISANTAQFELQGGKYGIDCIATGAGSVTLQKLAGDGATYVTAATAFSTTAGYATADLPCGLYRLAVVTFTAVYVTITRIQGE
jgi:hypothetical protein